MGRRLYEGTSPISKGVLHFVLFCAGMPKNVWFGRGCKVDMTRLLDPLSTFCIALMGKFVTEPIVLKEAATTKVVENCLRGHDKSSWHMLEPSEHAICRHWVSASTLMEPRSKH